jgi:hypothetical protein
MKRFLSALLATVFVFSMSPATRAADTDPNAVLDKAIKALGGQEKLSKAEAATSKIKGTITINGNSNMFTGQVTVQGLDHRRLEFEGDFNGNPTKGMFVLNGDKGWTKFGDETHEMDAEAVAREKQSVYLQIIPATLVALKGKGFQLAAAEGTKVDDKPAVGIKAKGPDGRDFTLYFDQESGLPVKLVARVADFDGNEVTQETTFGNYKDFDGIKKATKAESKRDGHRYLEQEVTEFKVLDKVEPGTFAEPQ